MSCYWRSCFNENSLLNHEDIGVVYPSDFFAIFRERNQKEDDHTFKPAGKVWSVMGSLLILSGFMNGVSITVRLLKSSTVHGNRFSAVPHTT